METDSETTKKPKKTPSRARAPAKRNKEDLKNQKEAPRQGAEEHTEKRAEKPAPAVHEEPKFKKPDRYFEAVGRRKTAVARVRLFTRAGEFTVNQKPYADYFSAFELQRTAEDALKKMKLFERFRVSIKVSGGGLHAQAEAVRHGLSRCLIKFNPDFRKRLKRAGFLRRDPRIKERKKFGLKKARRAPQWAKR
ncbi:MAG: small subunit ribosomal protein S9 [Parcubacteria group bacterium Gr01-1014_33]|nr:MAG: small subunit ribosomal protein S9 [Parcubacteria group bacterium Gr01-1014_33]